MDLFTATRVGALGRVQQILKSRDTRINDHDEYGYTALHLAIANGRGQIVHYLLQHGAMTHILTHRMDTVLQMAAAHGHVSILKQLLKRDPELVDRISCGMSPLLLAIRGNHPCSVKVLLDHGAFVHQYCQGVNAMTEASKISSRMVKLLIHYGGNVNSREHNGPSCLTNAIRHDHISIVKVLLRYGVDTTDQFPLITAVQSSESSSTSIIRLLLAHGVDPNGPNEDGQTPLHFICRGILTQETRTHLLQILLDAGADVLASRPPLLCDAAAEGNIPLVKFMLPYLLRSTRFHHRRTILGYAMQRDNAEMVQLLLDTGTLDVDARDWNGQTPLIVATRYGFINTVRLLLARGASVMLPCANGNTPLITAANQGHLEIAELLLKHGANIMDRDRYGRHAWTVALDWSHYETGRKMFEYGCANVTTNDLPNFFIMAAQCGYTDIAASLLQRGVPIDTKGSDGETALIQAAQYGKLETVVYLLQMNANSTICDKHEKTALVYATESDFPEIMDVLLANGSLADETKDNEPPILCLAKSTRAIDTLLKYHVDIHARNLEHRDALSIAVEKNHTVLVLCLLGHGANPNGCTLYGVTLMMIGCVHNNLPVIQGLIDHGAEIDTLDTDGNTVLIHASQLGRTSIVEHLLERGADKNIRNDQNETALDVTKNDKIERLLQTDKLLETPYSTSNHDEACSICMVPFHLHEPVHVTVCRHTFHKACLVRWIRHSDACPNCRQVIWGWYKNNRVVSSRNLP